MLTSIQKIRIVAQKTRESYHDDIPLTALMNLDEFDAAIVDVEQQLRAAAQASGLIPALRETVEICQSAAERCETAQYRDNVDDAVGRVYRAIANRLDALLAAERPHP